MAKPDENSDSDRKTIRTTVTLPADAYAKIEQMAEAKRVSVAWVIRHAVERYLSGRKSTVVNRRKTRT